MDAFKRSIFCIIFGFGVGVAGFFINGFVFTKMYNWFIPDITGLNDITFWYSCGLCTIINYLVGMKKEADDNAVKKYVKAIQDGGKEFKGQVIKSFTKAVVAPFIALFFSWWIHCYC